jgi:hypothetical protein
MPGVKLERKHTGTSKRNEGSRHRSTYSARQRDINYAIAAKDVIVAEVLLGTGVNGKACGTLLHDRV